MNYLIPVITLIIAVGIFIHLRQISKETKKIMSTQAEFNEQIEAANTALEFIATSITSEAQQIREYIAANQGVDTSALDGVVERLESVAGNVAGIFEPVVEPGPEVEQPEAEAETASGEDEA